VAENTMDAFQLALKLGATGLESDVWLTADGVAVLHHDGIFGSRLRRCTIADTRYEDLPEHIPRLDELTQLAVNNAIALSLDVKDPAAFAPMHAVLSTDPFLSANTYVCCENFDLLRDVAPKYRDLLLVDSSRLADMKQGPERRLAQLAELGVTALNMHHSDWSGGLVALAHRFERLAFAWDAQFEHQLSALMRMGVDAVYSDWVDRMVDAAQTEVGYNR
jgi:glycerophosphoryl diester phosphodiesterase